MSRTSRNGMKKASLDMHQKESKTRAFHVCIWRVPARNLKKKRGAQKWHMMIREPVP